MTEDLVIIGGGLAGASAATLLARDGRSPLLIERETEPRHKICGEFLSVAAQACLARLGIDPLALGGSVIEQMRLVHGDCVSKAALPFTAIGLTRRTLDAALLAAAEAAGARVKRGLQVRAIASLPDRIEIDADPPIGARTLLLATGKHELRGAKRDGAGTDDDLVGFKSYFRLAPDQRQALDHHIELILFRDGYAGLQLVEGGIANLCLLVRKRRLRNVGRDWADLVAALRTETPHLARRLDGAQDLLPRPLTIARLPYGFLHRPSPADGRLFRLGDQLGVIPSFAGDGMSIALRSGAAAASAILRGESADAYHRRLHAELRRPVALASVLYRASRSDRVRALTVRALRRWPAAARFLARRTRLRA